MYSRWELFVRFSIAAFIWESLLKGGYRTNWQTFRKNAKFRFPHTCSITSSQMGQYIWPMRSQEMNLGSVFMALQANARKVVCLALKWETSDLQAGLYDMPEVFWQTEYNHGYRSTTLRQLYPKMSRRWEISVQWPVARKPSSTMAVPVPTKQVQWFGTLMNNMFKSCPAHLTLWSPAHVTSSGCSPPEGHTRS